MLNNLGGKIDPEAPTGQWCTIVLELLIQKDTIFDGVEGPVGPTIIRTNSKNIYLENVS